MNLKHKALKKVTPPKKRLEKSMDEQLGKKTRSDSSIIFKKEKGKRLRKKLSQRKKPLRFLVRFLLKTLLKKVHHSLKQRL